jgi:hypothetical protein
MLFDDVSFLQPVVDSKPKRLTSEELDRLARVERLKEAEQLGLGLALGSMSAKQLKGASEQAILWAS